MSVSPYLAGAVLGLVAVVGYVVGALSGMRLVGKMYKRGLREGHNAAIDMLIDVFRSSDPYVVPTLRKAKMEAEC